MPGAAGRRPGPAVVQREVHAGGVGALQPEVGRAPAPARGRRRRRRGPPQERAARGRRTAPRTSPARAAAASAGKRAPATPLRSGCATSLDQVVTSGGARCRSRGRGQPGQEVQQVVLDRRGARVAGRLGHGARPGSGSREARLLVDCPACVHRVVVRVSGAAVVTGGARGIGRGDRRTPRGPGYPGRGRRPRRRRGAGARPTRSAPRPGLAQGRPGPRLARRPWRPRPQRHGELPRVWCNNAGVGDDGRPLRDVRRAVRRLVEVNLLGTLWGMRAALAAFGEAGGDMVNVASLAGLPRYRATACTPPRRPPSSPPPRRCRRRRRAGVRVHALCPDGVDTALLAATGPRGARAPNWCTRAARTSPSTRSPTAAVALIGSRPGAAHRAGLARRDSQAGSTSPSAPGGAATSDSSPPRVGARGGVGSRRGRGGGPRRAGTARAGGLQGLLECIALTGRA